MGACLPKQIKPSGSSSTSIFPTEELPAAYFPLEELPAELQWMLFEYAPEAVLKLRLVGFVWRSFFRFILQKKKYSHNQKFAGFSADLREGGRVRDYFSGNSISTVAQRPYDCWTSVFPVASEYGEKLISYFFVYLFRIWCIKFKERQVGVTVSVPLAKESLFGIRFALHPLIDRSKFVYCIKEKDSDDSSLIKYSMFFNESFLPSFREWLGKRIGKVAVITDDNVWNITHVLGSVQSEALSVVARILTEDMMQVFQIIFHYIEKLISL